MNKEATYKCEHCGESHDQLPALAFNAPYYYAILKEEDKENIAECSSDFCIIRHEDQTDRFIRTVMTIQVNDACEDLDYGIWVSVSEKTFDEYKANFNKDHIETTYFGMICNEIPDYEASTLGLYVNVNTQDGGVRPEIIPHKKDHKLVRDWEDGITIEEAVSRVEKMMGTL